MQSDNEILVNTTHQVLGRGEGFFHPFHTWLESNRKDLVAKKTAVKDMCPMERKNLISNAGIQWKEDFRSKNRSNNRLFKQKTLIREKILE